MQTKPEELLISAIKAGNKKVFEYFFNAEYSNVKYFVCHYVKDYHSAEDITQETFLALWKRRELLDSNLNIKSYLFTIARNKALNYLRDRAAKVTDEFDKIELRLTIDSLSGEYIISKIDSMDMERTIESIFSNLPEKIRETFILSRKHGYTYEEIATKLGISVKVVEHNVSAALKIFRRHMRGFMK
ncbi:MAG: RNA polymerase sigma-70 factor [Rikenellaceae bacterium]|nr:RNA polymerase sigma-70 factor [Rikenellaceae bacterium]